MKVREFEYSRMIFLELSRQITYFMITVLDLELEVMCVDPSQIPFENYWDNYKASLAEVNTLKAYGDLLDQTDPTTPGTSVALSTMGTQQGDPNPLMDVPNSTNLNPDSRGKIDSDLVIYRTTLLRTFQVVTICRVDKYEVLVVPISPHDSKLTLAMSLFDLQDVCIAIGSIATLDLPMVVDLIGIYGLKGPYCTLTTTNWFLQALSVIPRGSWGDVARRSYHDPMGKSEIVIPEPQWLWAHG
ncbi:monosaccharide-sensing protein 2-like [Dorcoceras hygrometricum]|uniref:Monosaccharide-sensing protein 2-like n=2 Tax=Dorcoceras hygrometricum TaxID=472368 RepID=A0A2Z7BZ46_9LAMI|nr:monosaccharide-sensing protein 2-like [Dorcoceras hygrometricum]